MGFLVRTALWGLGALAVVVAAFVVYNAFFGGPPEAPRTLIERIICPPTVSIAPRAPDAPVDDVAQVRLGYSVADARATLLCRNPKYDIEFEPIWHTAVPSSVESRQRMSATYAPERVTTGLVGQAGHEVVFAVFQDIAYGETSQSPTPNEALNLVHAHYGPAHDRHDTPSRIDLWWLYGPNGKPVTPNSAGADPITAIGNWVTGGWDFSACQRDVTLDPLATAKWNAKCGISIHAQIDIRKNDPAHIQRYRIVAIDQARLAAAVENYREQAGVKVQ